MLIYFRCRSKSLKMETRYSKTIINSSQTSTYIYYLLRLILGCRSSFYYNLSLRAKLSTIPGYYFTTSHSLSKWLLTTRP